LSRVVCTSSMKACHSPGVIAISSVRLLHAAARVVLGSTGGPAQHLGYQILEPCQRHFVMRFVHPRIGVEPRDRP
jgi:hypothetical protein